MQFEVPHIFWFIQFTFRVTGLPGFWAGVVKSFEHSLKAIQAWLYGLKKKNPHQYIGCQRDCRCPYLKEETNRLLKAIEEANKKMQITETSIQEKDQRIGELDRLIERMEEV